MAQKDKVKELVGRGLGSYHTKALQQIDRIEKKNKEQNHKISILTNELDNDYLTKTEEGSVVSLEHSKEGMVYLDELQGNTLVNYCVDSSKELTLNGDIEAEGINVTVTDCVDNGLVDVALEGNTLVNLFDKNVKFTRGKHQNIEGANIYYQKEIPMATNGTFHIIAPIGDKSSNSSDARLMIFKYNKTNNTGTVVRDYTVNSNPGLNLVVSLTREEVLLFNCWSIADDNFNKNYPTMMILEGDWTDKEIPPYFEGMKSVGECEDNKLEILSKNGNFIELDNMVIGSFESDGIAHYPTTSEIKTEYYIEIPNGCTKVYFDKIIGQNNRAWFYDENKNLIGVGSDATSDVNEPITLRTGTKYIRCRFLTNDLSTKVILFFENKVEPKLNKKEISLSEPLRALPSGVKDNVVKIGTKWYIERKCKQEMFDGSSDEGWYIQNSNLENYSIFKLYVKDKPYSNSGGRINHITDIINSEIPGWSNLLSIEKECTHLYGDNLLYVKISNSKLATQDVDGFIKWLKNNNINIVYELATPIYEELPIDPTVNTYNDTTHLSNNSTIPCNMTVTNTGYNAIIKPSTKYTVAFDTNKSGTVGINLAGSKVTTNNNVATVTTPSTLVDDTLRLTGKGIKASNVRLLEGDKTNWIPSHFEGMQSSFEDKLQDDGTYKMEILSNNKNLVNPNMCRLDFFYGGDFAGSGDFFCIEMKVKKDVNYTINGVGFYGIYLDSNRKGIKNISFKNGGDRVHFTGECNATVLIRTTGKIGEIDNYTSLEDFISKIQIEEGLSKTDYIPNKHNKIQFSSIEPLRGVGDVKDRFVFKDGKLMIERNCHEFIFNGSEYWVDSYQNFEKYYVMRLNPATQFVSAWSNTENMKSSYLPSVGAYMYSESDIEKYHRGISSDNNNTIMIGVPKYIFSNANDGKQYLANNPMNVVVQRKEPTYEEIPFELQKIILEGYENGTLFFDTNIPPTSTVTYAGETPIVKATKLNKTEVLNNTNDINDNIVPYLMDMDYRVVCLQLEGGIENVSMARLFGGTYEMLQRDILSNRYSKEEYKYRLDAYLSANKITEDEYNKLGDMLND